MDLYISPQERLDLKRLLNTTNCEDNTKHIREVKHSTKIQRDVMELVQFQRKHRKMAEETPEIFELEAQAVASFLYVNYTDIFKRILRNEINYEILGKVLDVLKAVEDEKVDQHEGSVLVGKVLKEMYLDSAVRHGNNLDKKYQETAPPKPVPVVEKLISWKEYKNQGNPR
jgi:hypothetical protein